MMEAQEPIRYVDTAERPVQMTEDEAFGVENAVRELLLKGVRKRKPFTDDDLDKAVADGVGQILVALKMYYPDIEWEDPEWEKAVHRAMEGRQSYGHSDDGDGKIRVHYYDDNVDEKLDARLKRAMAKHGYKWHASGYDTEESRRDNCFERA